MVPQDYLTLRLNRLRLQEEWAHKGTGLSLIFPRGGTGNYLSGTITHRLVPGDVLVADAAVGGHLCLADKGELLFWSFSVCFEHLFPLFAGREISLLQNVTERFKAAKVYPGSSAVAKECHKLLADVSPQFNIDHRSQLLRAVAAILTLEFKQAQTQRTGFVRIEDHMVQVFEKLSSDELLTSSVDELAGKFGCSRRHLSRLFHQHFGCSVASLRMEMRLLKAVSLLRDPDSKVINVAEQCGFNHLGLFNTCFKRRFGTSPGQWRKTTAEREDTRNAPAQTEDVCPFQLNGMCPMHGTARVDEVAIPESAIKKLTAREKPGHRSSRPPQAWISNGAVSVGHSSAH